MDPQSSLRTFLDTAYPPELLARGGAIQVRALAPEGSGIPPVIRWFDGPDDVARWPLPEDRNVYITPSLRQGRDGSGKGCVATATVWVDIDEGGEDAVARAVARCSDIGLPPTLQVESSPGKAHLWWRLAEPFDLSTEERRAAFSRQLRAVTDLLGGDPACAEPARVMRLPGSRNVKPKYGDSAPLARVVLHHSEHVFAWERLVEAVPVPKAAARPSLARRGMPAERLPDPDAPALPRCPPAPFLDACLFVRHAAAQVATLPEPLWARLAWALAPLGDDGRRLFHDLSRPHPGYDPGEADRKLDHAVEHAYRPPSCADLAAHGFPCPNLAPTTGLCRLRPTRNPLPLVQLGPAAPGEVTAQGGRTVILGEHGDHREVAAFWLEVVEERHDPEAGAWLRVRIHRPAGPPLPVDLPASSLADLKDLGRRLASVLATGYRVDARSLPRAVNAWLAASEPRSVRMSRDFGFATDGQTFLGRRGLDADGGPVLDLGGRETAARLGLITIPEAEVDQLLTFLLRRWPDVACGSFAARALLGMAGWALVAPVLEARDSGIPALCGWLTGPSGLGKSTSCIGIQALFGDFTTRGHLVSFGSTPLSIERAAHDFRGALLVVDDAKHGVLKQKDVGTMLGILQRMHDRTARQRLRPDGNPLPARANRSTVLVEGEDVLFKEASIRARYFGIPASTPMNRTPEALAELTDVLPRLSGLTSALVSALRARPHWPAAHHASYRRTLGTIEAALPGGPNKPRVARSAAAIVQGWALWVEFAALRGVLTADQADEEVATFERELTKAAARQVDEAAELSPAQRWRHDLEQLLATGEAWLDDGVGEGSARAVRLGFVKDGVVCVLPEPSVSLINQKLHREGDALPPAESIGADLARLGWLARTGKDRLTSRVRDKGGLASVWVVKPGVVGGGEGDG